jgi:hypothetical protein
MKIPLINLEEIDSLFIVSITNGYFVSTGSFIAFDIEGNQYFAHSSFVEKHNDKFVALKGSSSSFFVLVDKEIWGPKWDNRENISIKFISNDKSECENQKDNLFYRKIIKYNLQKMELSSLESINVDTVNIKCPFANEIDILRKLLIDLNKRLD